jgi:hypothetical protein
MPLLMVRVAQQKTLMCKAREKSGLPELSNPADWLAFMLNETGNRR